MSNANAWIDSGDGSTGIYCDADADNNLLQLKLKKPKAWKWELTTSRSSPNIAMPRIMLFDHEGNLLVDANQQVDDAVYRAETKPSRLISSQCQQRRKARKFSRDKSATTELDLDKLQPQDDEDTGLGSLDSADRNQWFRTLSNDSLRSKRNFNSFRNARRRAEEKSGGCEIDIDSLQICEATDTNSRSQSPLPICEIIDDPSPQPEDIKDLEEELNIDAPWRRKLSLKTKNIESADDSDICRSPLVNVPVILSDTEEPSERQYISKASWKPFHSNGCLNVKPSTTTQPLERRATSFKEVRFNVDPEVGLKPKRRYRRSNSNGLPPNLTHSRSILERQSAMKCRLSSPEFETPEFQEFQMAPRYYLRTSRAGTLVVAEEITRNKRVRRRAPKTSSTENCLTVSNSSSSLKHKGTLNSSLGDVCSQSQSVNNFGDCMKGQMQRNRNGRHRRKLVPIRRNKSDGNILLGSSSSEDEKLMNCDRKVNYRKNAIWRHKTEDVQKYIKSCE